MLTIQEIKAFMDSDRTSEKKMCAERGQQYYEGRHEIENYRLFYFDSDGIVQEDKYRSNIKISHPFFTEIVDQQVQYMLSGAMGDNPIKSDLPELQEQLDLYFNDEFWSEMQDVLTGTIAKGFDYLYAYYSSEERLKFQYADSMGVVEVRAKDTDDKCAYVIYWYIDRIEKGHKVIKRIQVWDAIQVTYYVEIDNKIVLDESEKTNPKPHIIRQDEKGRWGSPFGFIPFFRLDNNRKQFSGLKPIKELIDDYDLMCCGLSNNITDAAESLFVVKGFQGDNLDELMQNIKVKKHIGVDNGGGIETHTVDIPYEARMKKAELDEKNIYRFGMAFNSSMVGDGNITNVVIKSRYALLDLKANKLEIKLKAFLKQIIEVVLDEVNRVNGTDYRLKDVWFDFKREIMTNAADNAQIELTDAQKEQVKINTLLGLAGRLDDETIIQSICEVLDIDYEEIKSKLPVQDEEETTKDDLNALNQVMVDE